MENKKLVGKVNENERDEIKKLFERKNGLTELLKILNPDDEKMYNKMIEDMGKTSFEFQKWWDEKALKYKWLSKNGYSWEIDFNDCCIYLIKQ